MYIPKIKITPASYTQGDLFNLPNGKPYSGYYFEDYKGNVYNGKSPSDSTSRLDRVKVIENTLNSKLVTMSVKPVPGDYDRGLMTRYFIKDTTNGTIAEVNKELFDSESAKLYIKGITIDWIIEKPVKDIIIEGNLFQGAATRNKLKVQQAEQQLRGISQYITKYDEFVEVESYEEGYSFEELPYKQKVKAIDLLPSNIQKPVSSSIEQPKKVIKPSVDTLPAPDTEFIRKKPKPLNTRTKLRGGGGGEERILGFDENTFNSNQEEQLL